MDIIYNTGSTNKALAIPGNPRLVAVAASSIRIHKNADAAFKMSQKLQYQADVKNLKPNFIGLPTCSIPFAVEKNVEGKAEFHVFAGWCYLQRQFGTSNRMPNSIPLMVFPSGGFSIETEAFRYLHTLISRTLCEDTFLVHAMDFAKWCNCKDAIVTEQYLRYSKPNRYAEEYMRVGEKRAKRQLDRYRLSLIDSVRGGKQ